MPTEIRSLANAILNDPVCIETDKVASTVDTIDQTVYMVSRGHKPTLLKRLIERDAMSRTLVFTRTKRGADKLVARLQHAGIESAAIHGNKNQNARTRALDGFKAGRVPVLVATDIAARGIDVLNVTHVVNFDIPSIRETYVHRIGRTGRAGATGIALSLCAEDERRDWRAIERLIDQTIPVTECDNDLLSGDGEGAVETPRQSRGAVAAERRERRESSGDRAPRRSDRRPERRTDDHSEGRKPYAGKYQPRSGAASRSSSNRGGSNGAPRTGAARTGAPRTGATRQERPEWTKPTAVKPAGRPYTRNAFGGKPYVGQQGPSANADKKDWKPRSDGDGNTSGNGSRDSRPAWKQSSDKPYAGKKFSGDKKYGDKKFNGKPSGKAEWKPRRDDDRSGSRDSRPAWKQSSDKPYAGKKFSGDKKYGDKKFNGKPSGKAEWKPRRDDDRNGSRDSRPAWKQSSDKPYAGKKFSGDKKFNGKPSGKAEWKPRRDDDRSGSRDSRPAWKQSSDKPYAGKKFSGDKKYGDKKFNGKPSGKAEWKPRRDDDRSGSRDSRPAWKQSSDKPYAGKKFSGDKKYGDKKFNGKPSGKAEWKPRRDDDRSGSRDSRPAWKQSSDKPYAGKKFSGKSGDKKFEGKRTHGSTPRADSTGPKPTGKSSSDKPIRRSERTGYSPRNTRRAGGGLKRRTATQGS